MNETQKTERHRKQFKTQLRKRGNSGKRELFFLSFTCDYVVSVRRGFLFLLGAWDGLRDFNVALPGPSI